MADFSRDPREHWLKPHFSKNEVANSGYTTIGMDVSDRKTKVCVMAKERGARRIIEETTIPTTKDGLRAYLSGKSPEFATCVLGPRRD